MSARDQYYQRVRPAIGEVFAQAKLAIWGVGTLPRIAEALARTGLTAQRWFEHPALPASFGFCWTFGATHRERPAVHALQRQITEHNGFEDGWDLQHRDRCLDLLRKHLASDPPDVLLAEVDDSAPDVLEIASSLGVPLLLLYRSPHTTPAHAAVVWHPDAQVDQAALRRCVEELAALPQLVASDGASHLDDMEAQSLALSLLRWMLAPERPSRPDLQGPLVQQGKCVVLRGSARWPWETTFLAPREGLFAVPGAPRYTPPDALLGQQRLLVLGLGTASLFAVEAARMCRELTLLDCKAVSPFNPVRQVYSTNTIGDAKHLALSRLIQQRRDPEGDYALRDDVAGLTRCGPEHHLVRSGELMLSRRVRGSRDRFSEILDAVDPTIAIVGMGRSRDDNFLATAELRRRGIPHITPTAFPGVTHYKHVVTDGLRGPCYDCLQGHLAIDGGAAPTLSPEERDLYYGGTQPATLAETLPSAESLVRLFRDLALPPAARPPYLQRELADERNCFVGANRVERQDEGGWLYGVSSPFSMVTYGMADLVGARAEERCPCGRVNNIQNVLGS